jgi:branched-chain amino acid aminotransferase
MSNQSLMQYLICPQIPYEELSTFDEVLAAGTAAALVPIKSITLSSKGDKFSYPDAANEPGACCVKLLTTLKGIQQGRIEDKQDWLCNVPKPEQWGKGEGKGMDETVDQLP